jgi:hypothetical protein
MLVAILIELARALIGIGGSVGVPIDKLGY